MKKRRLISKLAAFGIPALVVVALVFIVGTLPLLSYLTTNRAGTPATLPTTTTETVDSTPSTQSTVLPVPTTTTPSENTEGSTQSQTSQRSNQSYPSYKPYVAPVCTKTPIPYKTTYVNVTYLKVGETSSWGGRDGYYQTCTADSSGYKPADYTYPAYDKTVYVGTYQAPSSYQQPKTYQQAENFCRGNGVPSNSSAWSVCISAYLSQ